ncbi:MAG: LamG-like jellyroll fold domain-containing protein [Spirochaetales bacterium]|jgi:hypothetical protein
MKNLKKLNFLYLLLALTFIYNIANTQDLRTIVPDVAYSRKLPRTYVFSRAQFIYSLGNADYLHHWVDRPLFLNPTYDDGKQTALLMSQTSYDAMQQTAMSYGIDGFAYFPQTARRAIFSDYIKQSKTIAKLSLLKKADQSELSNFSLLTELIIDDQQINKAAAINLALNNPSSFKINGKVVISSYNIDKTKLANWQDTIANLKKTCGDKFIFLPSIVYFDSKPPSFWQKKFHQNQITLADVNSIKEYLRQWIRATDGIYISNAAEYITPDRTFDADFYSFIIRVIKNVLSEAEFKSKYFGLSAVVGHENTSLVGYTLSSDGTNTLRSSFNVAMKATPDFINIPEWDEQNENTSLQPTVYNGLTSNRIMNYYMNKIKGNAPSPIKNDASKLPNLLISYRKQLTLGEKLNIEILNVPDNTFNKVYTAQITLEDINGKIVYTSPTQSFSGSQFVSKNILIPSEQLYKYNVLVPKLKIVSGTVSYAVNSGLNFINVFPTVNSDYKWVKQSIRDISQPSTFDFKLIKSTNSLSEKLVSANIEMNEPLRFVELLDNNDVVYSYTRDSRLHEDKDHILVKIEWEAFGGMAKALPLSGDITLNNAPGQWVVPKSGVPLPKPIILGNTFNLTGQKASVWRQRIFLSIPQTAVETASIKVNIPGIISNKELPIANLINNRIYGIAGPKGFNMVISHYVSQDDVPDVINNTKVSFTVPVIPESQNSVYSLQAISMSGKIYRSKPIKFAADSTALRNVTVYSESKNAPINLVIPYNLVPDLKYEFTPKYGSAFVTSQQMYSGILGGYFGLVTNIGGGNAGDDSPFINGTGFPDGATRTDPAWLQLTNGNYGLYFDGIGNHISLPQNVIPRLTGYTIVFDVKPDSETGNQTIIANRSIVPGSIELFTKNGLININYVGVNASLSNKNTNIKLPQNQWTNVKIKYDLATLHIYINGNETFSMPLKGPGRYETPTDIGGFDKSWFKGTIKSLHIIHSLN